MDLFNQINIKGRILVRIRFKMHFNFYEILNKLFNYKPVNRYRTLNGV